MSKMSFSSDPHPPFSMLSGVEIVNDGTSPNIDFVNFIPEPYTELTHMLLWLVFSLGSTQELCIAFSACSHKGDV